MTAKPHGGPKRESKASGKGVKQNGEPGPARPPKKPRPPSASPPKTGQDGNASSATDRDSPTYVKQALEAEIAVGRQVAQAEAAQRESEMRYRTFFDQAADSVVVFDPETLAIVEFNDEACRRLGYTRAEFGKLRISDFEVIESAEDIKRHGRKVTADDVEGFETKHRTKTGAVLDIEVRAKAVAVGGKVFIQGLWHDVTARKRAEEELKILNATLEQRIAERTKEIQMLHDIASMANRAQNPEQALEYCLQRVATYNGWCFGHALLPAADDPDELVPAHAWYAENPARFRRFREVTFGLRLHRGQGLSGRVLASGKPEWTTALWSDLIERRALVAQELGIGTAVAFPVPLGEKVVAVLEFFSDRVIQPNGKTTDAMVGVGLQLGRVIERAEFQEHLLTIAENIQQGIAQDLHDDVGQELTGLGLKAQTLADVLAPATAPAGKLAADIVVALDRTHDKVRALSRGLLPIELEEGLLADALAVLAAATTASGRLVCKVDCSHPDPVFDSRVSVHLYRIAQEAVANALRHSGAHSIRITLARENGEIALRVEDDGTGLSAEAGQTGGMGLRTMHYRAGLIGGKLEIGSGPRGGTQVACRVAVPPENQERKK